ncbi:MAG: metal ABC transporter substrate-binding protein [Thiotrichales bacterium]|nr:MAG: metal ABC transporter substrate-binding protein [Thiotrichales bacterium]
MSHLMLSELGYATWQTIYMVFISSFLSIFLGLGLGVVLFITAQGQMLQNRMVNKTLGGIVNVGRSIPFIILMVSLIPITKFIVGSSIGINAAIVPLTITAIPFFARIAESGLFEISQELVDAAISMGASSMQVIYKVVLPETFPSLARGATLTVIDLIGCSAMAGAVGGGGLGELAINYGYYRFNIPVMLATIVVLVVMVQLVQWIGNWIAKKRVLMPIIILSTFLWIGCGVYALWPTQASQVLKVGVMAGPMENIMKVAKQQAKSKYNINLKIIPFTDYVLPNRALNSGDIDANIFQTIPFLEQAVIKHHYNIQSIAKTFVYPMGLYSHKIKTLKDLPNKAIVAIPNDPSNEGRALLLLQQAHLIKLKPGVGLLGTPRDIINNPENLDIRILNSAQIPRALDDVDLAAVTNDFLKSANLKPKDALVLEKANSPYANVVVVKSSDTHKTVFKKLVQVIHSKAFVKETLKYFPKGGAIITWKDIGNIPNTSVNVSL